MSHPSHTGPQPGRGPGDTPALPAIPEQAGVVLLAVDRSGVLRSLSPATGQPFGVPAGPGEPVVAALAAATGVDPTELHRVLESGLVSGPYAARWTLPDGGEARAAVTLGPFDPADPGSGACVVVRSLAAGEAPDDVPERRFAAQEGLFRALSRRSWDSALVMDAELNVVYASPSVGDVLGRPQAELPLLNYEQLVHPDDADALRVRLASVLATPDHTERFTCRLRDPRGSWRWIEQTMTNCLTDPDIGGIVGALRDVTTEVQAEEAVRKSEARYRVVVETAQEGILVAGPDGSTVLANPVLADMLGITLAAAYGEHTVEVLLGPEAARVDDAPVSHTVRSELAYSHPDGRERILSVARRPLVLEDGDTGTLAMVSDVTDARQLEAKLRHQALHDPLTGLPNRYLLSDRLDMAAARGLRHDTEPIAIVYLDLDGFKAVNDAAGHAVGDRLLQQVADRLQRSVRDVDTLARLGGDEFAIVCEETDAEAAVMIADRIHEALTAPVVVDGVGYRIGASVGVAVSPPLDQDELLRRADRAMYRAKAAGGGTTVVHRAPD